MDFSDGTACDNSGTTSAYGDYPAARCRFWKQSEGLLKGEPIEASKGSRTVVCQRDLDLENPVYTSAQRNTWWVWARSDDGTWDWYPETALAQGASNQPVNGVALCR